MDNHQYAFKGPLKFHCAWYCPFAQRAWMTLLHKGIDFEYIEVDPYRQSRWWLEISRNSAKVPVIEAVDPDEGKRTTIIDSIRIVEYLEDLVPDTHSILPRDPNERAEHRFWMDHINTRIVPYIYRFLQAKDAGEYRNESREAMVEGLRELTGVMSSSGPFFNGTRIGAVDILLIPFAYRIDALLGHYRDFNLPNTGNPWSRYRRWYDSMLETSVFRATATDHANYRERLIEFYYTYSLGQGQADVIETG